MTTKKIKCALIGPGNIGTDLLAKLQRSAVLEPVWMVGIDPESDGLKRAREMGIKTTAEGVETEEQLTLLRAAGCDEMQGYLFGRPAPLAELDLASVSVIPLRRRA